MIEMAKEGKLPKNIRQIGQISGNQKIYMEDYVITYLKQNPGQDEAMRVIILYGKKEMVQDELCWFVSGAAMAEKDFFMEKTIIDQESWQKVNEIAGRFFPEHSVLGWAIIGNESTKDIEEQIMRTQKQFFRQDQKLYFEYNTEEKIENVYLYEKGKMRLQTGYYIYYDRNECMQNYMVSLRVAQRQAEEFESDRAAHQFREVYSEKKHDLHRRRSAALMTCLSLVLVMVIMVIGVTMLNNYERMQSMEKVLYQISGKIDDNTQQEAAAFSEEVEEDVQVKERLPEKEEATEAATQPIEDKSVSTASPAAAPEEGTALEESAAPEESPAPEESTAPVAATPEESTAPAEIAPAQQTTYIVQKGDTLARICMQYYGNLSNMDAICHMNGIEDKDNIFYGQKILLP